MPLNKSVRTHGQTLLVASKNLAYNSHFTIYPCCRYEKRESRSNESPIAPMQSESLQKMAGALPKDGNAICATTVGGQTLLGSQGIKEDEDTKTSFPSSLLKLVIE